MHYKAKTFLISIYVFSTILVLFGSLMIVFPGEIFGQFEGPDRFITVWGGLMVGLLGVLTALLTFLIRVIRKRQLLTKMIYKSTNSGFGYVIRLARGEEIISSLGSFAEKEDIKGAFFYGLGAVENVSIGRYILENKEYKFRQISGVYELASLNGNISMSDDGYIIHAHAVLGDQKLSSMAGHIKTADVAITCEIFVHLQHGVEMRRVYDDETGLNLLRFE